MITKVSISVIFNCTLERAFKTPMLSDICKVHTGYGFIPRVTHTTGDKDWGAPGSSKKVHMARSLFHKGGFASVDRINERKENQSWKIQVDDFQTWMLGFYKFEGEWKTTAVDPNTTRVEYTYHLHSASLILYPFNWLFGKVIWKSYMNQIVQNIDQMIQNKEPYLFE